MEQCYLVYRAASKVIIHEDEKSPPPPLGMKGMRGGRFSLIQRGYTVIPRRTPAHPPSDPSVRGSGNLESSCQN